MNMLVVLVGIGLLVLHRFRGQFVVPRWIFTAIGIFLIVMLVRNLHDASSFVMLQADEWYPFVKSAVSDLLTGILDFFKSAQQT